MTGTFTLGFGTATPVTGVTGSVASIQAALDSLLGAGNGTVSQTGASDFTIALRGALYLTFAVQFTVSGGATVVIDPTTIKLAKAWSVEPQAPASFEVGLFGDVHVPDVKVTVYSNATPSVVVFESDGSTAVTQGNPSVTTNDDTIRVRLSSAPASGSATVSLGDNGAGLISYSLTPGGPSITSLNFTSAPGSWDTFVTVYVRGVDDGVIRSFHRADLSVTAAGYNSFLSTVTIGDDNYPGVTVTESGGSTNVIEYQGGDFGLTQSAAATAGLPFQDSYTVALTERPGIGEMVTVTAQAQPTRTSQTGGIVSFQQQLVVCLVGPGEDCTGDMSHFHDHVDVTFDSSTWNTPQVIAVRALENDASTAATRTSSRPS